MMLIQQDWRLLLMKENKDVSVRVRITSSQKQEIDDYCESNHLTVSKWIRSLIEKALKGDNHE